MASARSRFGNPDEFKLLSSDPTTDDGLATSTQAMQVSTGCVVQVITQKVNPDGSCALAVALTFVPGVVISDDYDENGKVTGRRLVYSQG